MPIAPILYPATPGPVDESVTAPSAGFRREVRKVLLSIFAFLLVYLVLLVLAGLLAAACFYLGIMVMTAGMHVLAILGGLGLMGVGVMVLIFLIKFMFSVTKVDRSGIVEIGPEQQPELFAFIRQLTSDTHTPFPKRIYLSTDVNASVFYDSGFWSMFLPIRKNLLIGMGLVNALTVSEFKAVMAHEFGHFSQRSMKLGSYVYNMNRVIYNMLFDNQGYASFLKGWAEIHGLFAFFAMITVKIAEAIQWVLRQMYGVINRHYMGLSREMEFHADAVAASVSGSESLVSALRRIEMASAGYNIALQKCDEWFREKKITRNLFRNHKDVMWQLARENDLPLRHEIPLVTDEFLAAQSPARINFKDQWASHPSTGDRVAHLRELAIKAEMKEEPAWLLFADREKLEEQMTAKIYEKLEEAGTMEAISEADFREKLESDARQFTLPSAYRGFYDNRQLPVMDPDEILAEGGAVADNWEAYFNTDNAGLQARIQALANDLETVKAIAEKKADIKTFDFDGVKYRRGEAPGIQQKLQKELDDLQAEQSFLDRKTLLFLIIRARQKGMEQALLEAYRGYFAERDQITELLARINKILEGLAPVFAGETLPVERIRVMIDDLTQTDEPAFKEALQQWLDAGAFDHDPVCKQEVTEFLHTRHSYFNGTAFLDRQLIFLHNTLNRSWEAVIKHHFFRFRKLLEQQLEWTYENEENRLGS